MPQPDSPLAPGPSSPPLPVALPIAAPRAGSDAPPRTATEGLPKATPLSLAAASKAPRLKAMASSPTSTAAADDELPPLATASDILNDAPAWLISAIIHMLMIIILGLIWVANEGTPQFIMSLSMNDDGGEDLATGELEVPFDLDEQPLEPSDSTEPLQMATNDPTETSVTEMAPVNPLGLVESGEKPAIQMALSGREAGMKDSLLRAYGGTAGTETSVTEALKWLARNQGKNGMWSLTGKYADGANNENFEAATAMALLAFQGAGFTPEGDVNGPFTSVVGKGWNALLKKQDRQGNFFREGSGGNGRLYTQALCTIALCELYGMTQNSEYREPAQKAVNYCIKVQAPEGGWRYQPGFDSDLSVTGWFVMALQSARMAGLEVDSPAMGRIGDFLDTVSQDGGAQYSYVPGQGKKLSMTAEGLLCRQYLGWPQNDNRLQRGSEVLLKNLPDRETGHTHVYYWYYAAQVCHHMEGKPWREWNAKMRDVVPAMQIRDGKERGSWDPFLDETQGVSGGGRLFVTCLATYMLEVYYRHLPIYQLELINVTE
jgi:hypothetical protein